MSYSVHVFRREVQATYKASKNPEFFEDAKNLKPFTAANRKRLLDALELRGWKQQKPKAKPKTKAKVTSKPTSKLQPDSDSLRFKLADPHAEAYLTTTGLYFAASGEDAVFEILMFASELAGKDLAKFDPQAGTWE